MKSLSTLAILLISIGCVYAQKNTDVVRVKDGSDIGKTLPYSLRFQYDTFLDGQAVFRNGTISKAKFNYSLVHGQVMFIAPSTDTMLLNDIDFIRFVSIDQTPYYFYQGRGHVEVAGEYGRVRLAKKLFLVQMGNEKYASYDQYSSTSAISSYSSYMNGNGVQFLEGRDKVILKKRSTFYLLDKNDRIHLVNRGSLMKIFPSNKSEINRFLKEKGINLENEEDLKQTLAFCSTL
ncbi:hypothetical protein [Dyadobacter sp. CY323]|uniref:hypothetical protein n=1 Tax=Dyadobacter sp. CY323 TaxID=2907302 RepID=UPI001F2D0173|nr:hypothetical protein [Dyadobacter sp. CY323]MCE6990092.1 hypothetical protein [Dyadobacter sp. CY323]